MEYFKRDFIMLGKQLKKFKVFDPHFPQKVGRRARDEESRKHVPKTCLRQHKAAPCERSDAERSVHIHKDKAELLKRHFVFIKTNPPYQTRD